SRLRQVGAFSPERLSDIHTALYLVERFLKRAFTSRQHSQAETRVGLTTTVVRSKAEFKHFPKTVLGRRILFQPDADPAQIPERVDLTSPVIVFARHLQRFFQHRARFIVAFQAKVGFTQSVAREGDATHVRLRLPQAQRLFKTLKRQLILLAP